jgi:two-component system chemotaxis response regulator CheB
MFAGVLRVAVVDDSALYRRMILNVLGMISGVEVVGTASNGFEAVELIAQAKPDVVTLDVQMPRMDGIEVLKALKQRGLVPRVIMVSSLTAEGAPTTVNALMEGAFDFILKPAGVDTHVSREAIHRELAGKLAAVRESMVGLPPAARPMPAPPVARPAVARPAMPRRYDAIVIGTSTGGPQALRSVIPLFSTSLDVPVLVVQHIPAQFTASLAERLNGMSWMRVVEAADGMLIEPGHVYIAPGDRHLGAERRDGGMVCVLDDSPRRRGCRPSVDHLLESAARAYEGRVLAAVLTGMGCDGLEGCRALKQAGGGVMAQSADTCVVYGMPKAVIDAGLADEIVPLDQVATRLEERLRKELPAPSTKP